MYANESSTARPAVRNVGSPLNAGRGPLTSRGNPTFPLRTLSRETQRLNLAEGEISLAPVHIPIPPLFVPKSNWDTTPSPSHSPTVQGIEPGPSVLPPVVHNRTGPAKPPTHEDRLKGSVPPPLVLPKLPSHGTKGRSKAPSGSEPLSLQHSPKSGLEVSTARDVRQLAKPPLSSSPEEITSGEKFRTFVMANGKVLDLREFPNDAVDSVFGKGEVFNVDPATARTVIQRQRRQLGDQAGPASWRKALSAFSGDSDDEDNGPRRMGSMRFGSFRRQAQRRADQDDNCLSPRQAQVLKEIRRQTQISLQHTLLKTDALKSGQSQEPGPAPTGLPQINALSLLPPMEAYKSANQYVLERVDLLRQSDILRTQFAQVCQKVSLERRSEIQDKVDALEEKRGHSHLAPIDRTAVARGEKRKAEKVLRTRLHNASSIQASRHAIVDSVHKKQERAERVRKHFHEYPLVVKKWQILFCHFKMIHNAQTLLRAGYQRRWRFLVILYMARWWRIKTKDRHTRIETLKRNFIIRRQLPVILSKLRRRRRVAAAPILVAFFRHYLQAVRLTTVMLKFQSHVKRVQRFLRRRRTAKQLMKIAMIIQWDAEHDRWMANELALAIPHEFRDRVIDTVLSEDLKDYTERRRDAIDRFISQLEVAEQEMIEENTMLLREQERALAAMSVTLQKEDAAVKPIEPIFTLSGRNAAPTRRKFVAELLKLWKTNELETQHRERHSPTGVRQTRSFSIKVPNSDRNARNGPITREKTRGSSKNLRTHSFNAGRIDSASSKAAVPKPSTGLKEQHAHGKTNQDAEGAPTSRGFRVVDEIVFELNKKVDVFDIKRKGVDDAAHPLHELFTRVKRPKLPARRFLCTKVKVQKLIEMARVQFLKTWREKFNQAQTQRAIEPNGDSLVDATEMANLLTQSSVVDEVDLSFIREFLLRGK